MISNNEKIIQKIRKLLALSTSSNIFEAELASSKVESLLSEYNITLSSVFIDERTVEKAKRFSRWKGVLASAAAELCFCESLRKCRRNQEDELFFVGRDCNVIAAISMYEYFCSSLIRIAETQLNNMEPSHRRKASESIKKGIALNIRRRVMAKIQSEKGELSELRQKCGNEISIYYANDKIGKGRNLGFSNNNFLALGYSAGESVGIDRQMAGRQSNPVLLEG